MVSCSVLTRDFATSVAGCSEHEADGYCGRETAIAEFGRPIVIMGEAGVGKTAVRPNS